MQFVILIVPFVAILEQNRGEILLFIQRYADIVKIDLVKSSDDLGKEHLLERIRSRKGEMTIDYAYELNIGNKEYELIEL